MDGLVPRIAVPDEYDRATVIAALMHYSRVISAQALVSCDIVKLIKEQRIVVDLLDEILTSVRTEAQAKVDGLATLSDEDLSEILDRFQREINGSDDTD